MSQRRNVDDASRRGLDDPGQQQAGEQEVPKVVDPELQLQAVLRLHAGACHHTCVVDEDVDLGLVCQDVAGALLDRLEVREVQPAHHELPGPRRLRHVGPDLRGRLLGLLDVAARHHDPRTYPAEVQHGGLADARVAPRDDDRLAVEPRRAAALARE